MKFNVDKCVVMNFGTSRTKTKYEYKMNNQTLETVKHNPYLGVELTDNLKYNDHIDTITSKASRVLGFGNVISNIVLELSKKEHIKRWLDPNSNIVHRYGIPNTKLPSRKLNKYSGMQLVLC